MDKILVLTMLKIPGFGRKTVKRLMDFGKDTSSIRDLRDLMVLYLPAKKRAVIPSLAELGGLIGAAAREFEAAVREKAVIFSIEDVGYPEHLRAVEDPPLLLFLKGDHSCLRVSNSVAVVGTRTPTEYGLEKGFAVGNHLARKGIVVVSGLARGCDTAAHRGCLDGSGPTVAVLPSGFDGLYPEENRGLAEEIIQKRGCLVSEYPPGERPQRHYFIERDRIQSGLSEAVVVIETMVKDGTMHTVGFALRQKRRLAVLMHPQGLTDHPAAQGNQKLLAEGLAQPINSLRDLDRFLQVDDLEKSFLPPVVW